MDTSETYIKMRLAAIPDLGTGITHLEGALYKPTNDVYIDCKGDFYAEIDEEPYFCQLERQDQLQELHGFDGNYPLLTLTPFLEFVKEERKYFASMNQLWLAFVMKENHNKIWDGKAWT